MFLGADIGAQNNVDKKSGVPFKFAKSDKKNGKIIPKAI